MNTLLMKVLFMVLLSVVMTGASAGESPELMYKIYCWQCHGKQADGMGVNVRDMSVQPRNHSDRKDMSTRSDQEIFKAIKEGGQAISKSVLMPPWGGVLSDNDIHRLVQYLRNICQCSYGNI